MNHKGTVVLLHIMDQTHIFIKDMVEILIFCQLFDKLSLIKYLINSDRRHYSALMDNYMIYFKEKII